MIQFVRVYVCAFVRAKNPPDEGGGSYPQWRRCCRLQAMKNPIVHVLAIILSCCHYEICGWILSTPEWRRSGTFLMTLRGDGGSSNINEAPAISCEVVGSAGRMGSLFLRQPGSIALSRGVAPGCLSPPDCPIIVTTPSNSWDQVYDETLPNRKDDLCWVGNGMLLPEYVNSTIVVPHYGILEVGATPITSSLSPPTFVYGKHSDQVAKILQQEGIQTEIVTSWRDIQTKAAQKLLWASCMWLLCHSQYPPLTVDQVNMHTDSSSQDMLTSLVKELLPPLEDIIGTPVDLEETLDYFEAYSQSMPGAIPNKELAMNEVQERNGVWLALSRRFPQPFHEEFLLKVAGEEVLEEANAELTLATTSAKRQSVDLKDVDLTVWGDKDMSSTDSPNNVVVIGGGILGTSVALNLARQGIKNVTVLDRLSETELGATTPASWAWLNANNKSPPTYKWLNQLGMRSWRKDAVIMNLPLWSGALVQYKETPQFRGGYTVEGPLSSRRVQELEPQSNFDLNAGPIYYFPDEGCVDPAAAVRSMRQAAKELGVRFISDQNVTSLVRNEDGRITAVESYTISTSRSNELSMVTPADVVIVAAGIGSAIPALGGLPLMHSPGQIAYAKSSSSSAISLKRILVDTVRESHVLQRQDGTIVVGGGFLEVGAKPASADRIKGPQASETASDTVGSPLLDVAAKLAPKPIASSEFSKTERAVRPMPKDGRPAIGFLEPSLYTVVTHSGVTLSPLVGPLAATEIAKGLELDILQPFRPTRLFDS